MSYETKIRKRDWLLIISLVPIVFFTDRFSKIWALENIQGYNFHGPFGLVIHYNPGAMLGIFADLPPLLRVVSLSTGGAFLIFLWGALQYLIPMRSMIMRCGMSILLGGILGNVADRIVWGSVLDFLLLGWPGFSTPAFNLSDSIQWIGYFMIVHQVFTHGEQLWPAASTRKQVWVKPTFQLKYITTLVGVGVGFSIIAGVFAYTYLRITIEDLLNGRPLMIEDRYLKPFVFIFLLIMVSYTFLLFIIGRHLSHKTACPLHAFEKFLEDVLQGKDRKLHLRQGDELLHLEALAEKIRVELVARNGPKKRTIRSFGKRPQRKLKSVNE